MLARRRLSISLNTAVCIKRVPLRGRQPQVHGRSFPPHKQVEKLNGISFPPGTRCRFALHYRRTRVIHVVTAKLTLSRRKKNDHVNCRRKYHRRNHGKQQEAETEQK